MQPPITPGETPPTGETPPATPPTPTPPTPTEPGPPAAPTWTDGTPFDPERAKQALDSSRKEAERLKKQNEVLEAKVKAEEDAKLSEQDRLKKENDELKAKMEAAEQARQESELSREIERLAGKLEFADPEDACLFLLSRRRAEITFENGQPTNLDALLKSVLTDKPHWKKAATPTTPNPVPAHPPGGNQAGLTPEQAEQAQKATARAYAGTF